VAVFKASFLPNKKQLFKRGFNRPIKSCQAIEVVGGGASTSSDDFGIPGFPSAPAPRPSNRDAIEKGVDLSVLHAKTKGSMWIGSKSASGAFAVLSGGASGFTSGVADF
jgi:hypothetical protein